MKIKKTVVVTPSSKKTAKPDSSQPVASASAPEPKAAAGINRGKSTGMRVMQFQDHTLARNDDPKFRLTDTELAKLWRDEFPNSRAVLAGRIDESIVRGVRNLFNQGTGGHGTPGKTQDSKPYEIQNGKRVQVAYTRARIQKEETETKAPAAPAAKAPVKGSAPAKAKGKVVTPAAPAKAKRAKAA